MTYDPTLPVEGTECDAAQMRSQFTGLKALIDALAAAGVTGATVDSVTIGSGTSVNVSLVTGVLHFDFILQPGPPGEVTQAQLSNDLSNTANQAMLITLPQTSANTNAVNLLTITSGDFVEQTLIDKMNELISTLRR